MQDLPGKHDIPPRGIDKVPGGISFSMTDGNPNTAPTLLSIVFSTQAQYQQPVPSLKWNETLTAPGEEYKYKYIQPFEPQLLNRVFGGLEKTPVTGLTDFDVSKLALGPSQQANNRNAANGNTNSGAEDTKSLKQGSSVVGGSLMKAAVSSGSLHLAGRLGNELNGMNGPGAESSNDDATMMKLPHKKKKRKNPITATSSSGDTPKSNVTTPTIMGEGHEAKRRKKSSAVPTITV